MERYCASVNGRAPRRLLEAAAAVADGVEELAQALLVAYAGLLGLCSTLSVSVQPAPWPWLKLLSPSQRQQMPTKYSILCLCSAPTTWWT